VSGIDEKVSQSKEPIMLRPEIASEEAVAATSLEHRIYIAEGRGPVFLLVHGRTGDSSVMWGFSRCFSTFSPLTIAPQAPDSDPLRGYSWWPVGDEVKNPEHGKETYLQAVNRVEQFLKRASEYYSFSLSDVHAMGFSQGAGLVSGLSLLAPGIFNSVALLAGFVPKALFSDEDLLSRVRQSRGAATRYFIAHGTEDDIISINRAREGAEQLRKLELEVTIVEDPVAHKVGPKGIKAMTAWYAEMLE
jgi:phospholipase/carboxylesterase